MNKPNEEEAAGGDGDVEASAANQTKPEMTLKAIGETMENPAFTAGQLPALWRQAMEPGYILDERTKAWNYGISVMCLRCETFLQHAKIMVVLSGMPPWAWHLDDRMRNHAGNLFEQAGPEQLQQTLIFARQHPESWWTVREHILASAGPEQLTGPVVKQFDWCSAMTTCATMPDNGPDEHYKWRRIIEHIQQKLLDGSDAAWTVFLGIVEPGGHIGDTAELAKTIEQNQRPN